MRRILSGAGNLLVLAAVAALAVVLVKFGGLRGEQLAPQAGVFQSPLGPTLPPAPLPPTHTPAPTATPTPYVLPTVPGPFPPGPKVVYTENTHNGTITFWAASATNPAHRRPLATATGFFSVRACLSHNETRIAYTVLPPTAGDDALLADLWVVNVDGANRRILAQQVDIGGPINYPIWSPDDRFIAFRRQMGGEVPYTQMISMVDVQIGEETVLVRADVVSADEGNWLWPIDWSPDGRYFYYRRGTTGRVELWRVDVTEGNVNEYVTLIWEGSSPWCYFFSPDGQFLLCTVLKEQIPSKYAVVTVPTGPGKPETLISGASDGLYNPIWRPNGEVTVNVPQVGELAELRTINCRTRQERAITSSEGKAFIPRSWSPDGQWLAAQKFPGTFADLFLISQDGMQINRLPSSGSLSVIGWITGDLPTEVK